VISLIERDGEKAAVPLKMKGLVRTQDGALEDMEGWGSSSSYVGCHRPRRDILNPVAEKFKAHKLEIKR
jgi:hypothetical protein